MASDMASESLASVIGTWKLVSYVREVLGSTERFDQFGENPAGYLGYSADGRMYAIFVRQDRITPGDVVPTDEEGVKLLGTMVAYAGRFSLDAKRSFTISTCRGTKHGRAQIKSDITNSMVIVSP